MLGTEECWKGCEKETWRVLAWRVYAKAVFIAVKNISFVLCLKSTRVHIFTLHPNTCHDIFFLFLFLLKLANLIRRDIYRRTTPKLLSDKVGFSEYGEAGAGVLVKLLCSNMKMLHSYHAFQILSTSRFLTLFCFPLSTFFFFLTAVVIHNILDFPRAQNAMEL